MCFFYSSLAQSVEHSTVNRVVVGSSPTGGAKMKILKNCKKVKKTLAKLKKICYYNFVVRLHGQAVKTPPFHGGNRGSNPLGVTTAQ